MYQGKQSGWVGLTWRRVLGRADLVALAALNRHRVQRFKPRVDRVGEGGAIVAVVRVVPVDSGVRRAGGCEQQSGGGSGMHDAEEMTKGSTARGESQDLSSLEGGATCALYIYRYTYIEVLCMHGCAS